MVREQQMDANTAESLYELAKEEKEKFMNVFFKICRRLFDKNYFRSTKTKSK